MYFSCGLIIHRGKYECDNQFTFHSLEIIMRRTVLVISLLSIYAIALKAHDHSFESSFTVSFGGLYGVFNGDRSFSAVYTEDIHPVGVYFALGDGSVFLITRYQQIRTSGSSIVKNIPAQGKAEWQQDCASIGLRYLHPQTELYFDIHYVFTQVKESITTEPVIIPELAVQTSLKDRGAGINFGWMPRIGGPLGLIIDFQYDFMFRTSSTATGDVIPNLGGVSISGGLYIIL
jgi:hypothetical protein